MQLVQRLIFCDNVLRSPWIHAPTDRAGGGAVFAKIPAHHHKPLPLKIILRYG